MKKFLFASIILITVFSCSQQGRSNSLIDITSKMDKAAGYIDLVLSITDKKETDSTIVYKAQGLYKSDTVGIEISLKEGLTAGVVNGEMKNVFTNHGIGLHSIGVQSDKLLAAMIELYGIDSISNQMRTDLITLTAANLNEKDINYTSGEYKFKVFMETEQDNPELYVNFDFTNNLIFLNEKDVEYRKGVLKFLMKK